MKVFCVVWCCVVEQLKFLQYHIIQHTDAIIMQGDGCLAYRNKVFIWLHVSEENIEKITHHKKAINI